MASKNNSNGTSQSILSRPVWLAVSIFVAPVLAHASIRFFYSTPTTDFGTGSMFDGIATRYDFLNRALALNMDMGWRRVMVSEVTSNGDIFYNGNKKVQMLDLATGTADVAILLAQEYESSKSKQGDEKDGIAISQDVNIVGVDPSQNMINVGNEKLADRNLSDVINLNIGDARNLIGLKDNFFDTATMSFGIRNVPEKEIALCEIHRVLKKKKKKNYNSNVGKLAILEFSEPGEDAGIMGFFGRLFIRYVVPVVGAMLSGAPREYLHLQNSIKEFPAPQQFQQMMENLQCGGSSGKKGNGSFVVDELKQLNFGSVQLYLATPVYN
uniref:2-methoxy-6-polyprenyl-1,4-benzoquinol methylase, mitochondrial n=1 Tax=Eucampia antarctica TaxID=49252 RepID=A0A7S2RME0_9STRA